MTKVIGLFNQASSMGKTTLTINLGYHLVEQGKKVLAVDMDTHAWLTKQMRLFPEKLETTIYDALANKKQLIPCATACGIDVIPATKQLTALEANLAQKKDRQHRLKIALQSLTQNYDAILIDCPPHLGLLSVMCLAAADYVLVPIETTEKGIEGARDFLMTFKNVKENLNKNLKISGVVPTKYDVRRSHHKLKLESIQKSFSKVGITVHPAIGLYTDFENAWDEGQPLALYKPRHIAVQKLQSIAQELGSV